MIPLHMHLDYSINTIKIYKTLDYYIIVIIDECDSQIAKTKKINDIVKRVLQLTSGYPEVDLKFHHLKGYLSKKQLAKLHELIKNTTTVDRRTLISYMLLL